MTIEATKSVNATPFGMSLNASTATGVAWDNFERFMETKSGTLLVYPIKCLIIRDPIF